MGNGHREQGVGLLTDWMGMGDRGILACSLGHMLQSMVGSEEAQRTDLHHRAVSLVVRIWTIPLKSAD